MKSIHFLFSLVNFLARLRFFEVWDGFRKFRKWPETAPTAKQTNKVLQGSWSTTGSGKISPGFRNVAGRPAGPAKLEILKHAPGGVSQDPRCPSSGGPVGRLADESWALWPRADGAATARTIARPTAYVSHGQECKHCKTSENTPGQGLRYFRAGPNISCDAECGSATPAPSRNPAADCISCPRLCAAGRHRRLASRTGRRIFASFCSVLLDFARVSNEMGAARLCSVLVGSARAGSVLIEILSFTADLIAILEILIEILSFTADLIDLIGQNNQNYQYYCRPYCTYSF